MSTAGLAMAFNPDDPHDGHTGSPAGFKADGEHAWAAADTQQPAVPV